MSLWGKTMGFKMNGGWHINNSLDKFRFLDFRMGLIPHFKFCPREMISGIEGWYLRRGDGISRG